MVPGKLDAARRGFRYVANPGRRPYGLDSTFSQFELVGEIENRYELWGQPGKLKVTGFLIPGRMGNFEDAVALSQATDLDASDALAAVRTYQSRKSMKRLW
jgi:high affinity Mn2+ porin